MNHEHHNHKPTLDPGTKTQTDDSRTGQPHHSHKHHHHRPVKHADVTSALDEHAGHHTHDFLKRFWVCVALTVPVLALSHMIQNWLGFKISFPGDRYVLLVLSSAIYVYGGWP